jgi:hypothetical protein
MERIPRDHPEFIRKECHTRPWKAGSDINLIQKLFAHIHPWEQLGINRPYYKACHALYREMINKIKVAWDPGINHQENAEIAFRVACAYWEDVRGCYSHYFFRDEGEEIYFFKEVKPHFAGIAEFFMQLYQAILFLPENREVEKLYWQQESDRYVKFYASNHQLVEYWVNKYQDNDLYLFLRKTNDRGLPPFVKLYDQEPEYLSTGDGIITTFLALRRFYEYCIIQLKGLDVNSN